MIIAFYQPLSISGYPTQSNFTPQVEALLFIVILISILIASIVFGLMIFILIRFRESSDVPREKIQNQMRVEAVWIAFASILVCVLFLSSFPVTQSYLTEPQSYDEQVQIIAYKYDFKFIREDGNETIGFVNLEVNKLYMFNISSIDVVHSFYVHELAIKLDMIPGRQNYIYVEITQVGTYEVHCAEYCGFGHYLMMAEIIVT
jgi:heme/copper-type cytochrome/quinol oxidase subunit 2